MSAASRKVPRLKKLGVRMSWSRWNLYNFSKLRDLPVEYLTVYQQKWKAKSMTRFYHGELIGEKRWRRMFRRRIDSVVTMDPTYLAEHDGSDESSGRGADLERRRLQGATTVPYMQMTYAPLERRLDIAVFRALFASSIKQARLFCLRGNVKVNGEVMRYSGFLLNPGDMFQIDKNLVMWATGAKKNAALSRVGRQMRKSGRTKSKFQQRAERRENKKRAKRARAAVKLAARRSRQMESPTDSVTPAEKAKSVVEDVVIDIDEIERVRDRIKQQRRVCRVIHEQIKTTLDDKNQKNELSVKVKQALREMKQNIKSLAAKAHKSDFSDTDEQIRENEEKLATLLPRNIKKREAEERHSAIEAKRDEQAARKQKELDIARKAEEQSKLRATRNPVDPTKPYNTPWVPKPYMAPFAFIPRYLEVNHHICAAVYLRHPVARRNLSEIPSPFGPTEMQLAYNWYLGRR